MVGSSFCLGSIGGLLLYWYGLLSGGSCVVFGICFIVRIIVLVVTGFRSFLCS